MSSIMEEYGLPELPEPSDGDASGTARLVLFRQGRTSLPLGNGDVYVLADAQEYCCRDDTSGSPDWFVGWRYA